MNNCFICDSETQYFFSKQYNDFGLDSVNYFRCPNCGFVFSKTHAEMSDSKWEQVNIEFHKTLEDFDSGARGDETYLALNYPPYLQQAVMLNTLARNDMINLESCLDWGSGYGRLSRVLDKYFNIRINNFDKYMVPQENFLSASDMAGKRFATVINSAVFEHVTHRRFLDEINSYVDEGGCLVFHTVVCEKVPQDPDWFYLTPPVHCAFHTNKSMEILMEQWGYECSIYCPTSKMWVLYKKKPAHIESLVRTINDEFQHDYLYFKMGFMDYWK